MIEPSFILVRPQMGENIGATARAMLNFGLTRMRLVSPRDGWPNQKAVAMASGAGRLLDNAELYNSVSTAVADCDYVFATTARCRDLVKNIVTPERAMQITREMASTDKKVGFLFGPERTGLENDDLLLANTLTTVPVNPDFPSLNLAQCALLLAYEWNRHASEVPPEVAGLAQTEPAKRAEIERLADHFEERLENVGFFYPEQKATHMKTNLRNMWGRLPLTRAEVQTFHGMLRQIVYTLNAHEKKNSS